ncbi:hypothetical protein BsWGS_16019 [Bradybaena similaris]
MSKGTSSATNGAPPGMDQIGAMTPYNSCNTNSPGHNSQDTTASLASVGNMSIGVPLRAAPTPTDPKKSNRASTKRRPSQTKLTSKLTSYPMNRSLSLTRPHIQAPANTIADNTQPHLTRSPATEEADNTQPQLTRSAATEAADNTQPQLTRSATTEAADNTQPHLTRSAATEVADKHGKRIVSANEEKRPDIHVPVTQPAPTTDAARPALPAGSPLQQMFVLRKVNSPETPLFDESFRTSGKDTLSSRKGSINDENNLLSSRDSGPIRARSESAISRLSPPDQTLDPRRNSSQNNLALPENLISSNPRRDSAWTAEVLSIEIQVDYVMDPAELWGYDKKPDQEQPQDTDTVVVNLNLEIPERENPQMNLQKDPQKEVAVVTPVVSQTPDEVKDASDKLSDQNSVENGGPPDKDRPIKDPYRSQESIDLNLPAREHWANNLQFLLSTVGYAVDLSNVWRFPFLCYKNGGGAFLIPYFTTLIFGAMPVFFMEMCLGQFHRCGPTAIWDKMSPMFKGIGMASCFMSYIVGFYYNVIIAWSFFYLFASFTPTLPWVTCFNSFNSDNCWQLDWDTNTSSAPPAQPDGIQAIPPAAPNRPPDNRTYNVSVSVSASIEYFERGMLELHHSQGLNDLGGVKWQLALCTLLTFILLYFCLWKGVKSTGKVVYVTATLPYLIMTILLIRGVLLPGADEGIRYFITPKIDSLNRPKVWIDAAVQIFFSIGSGFGTHIAYSSYNKFHNNCKRDCIITVAVNSFTSLFSGVVIFSYLGYMSLRTHKDIDKVATEGPGLVFIVYPEAIATLPGSVFWAVLFFFMLLALGLDSAFGGLESPLTGLRDELSELKEYRYFREVITLVIIVSAFLFAIPCVLQGGIYVFTILDTFAAGTSIVFIVLCEVVAVSWFYGMPQFCADVEKMIGEKPSLFWRVCWKFVCPFLLVVVVASSVISYQPLTYRSSQGVYTYPYYANIIGWCIACSSMLMVPGYIIYRILINTGTCSQRLALAISPVSEHEDIRQKGVVTRFQRQHWISL